MIYFTALYLLYFLFLKKVVLLKQNQLGFYKGKSYLNNLLEFFAEHQQAYDSSNPVYFVYLDFQKAFDKIPRHRLLNKLCSYQIRGKVPLWISN